jgi:flagellar protein FlaG
MSVGEVNSAAVASVKTADPALSAAANANRSVDVMPNKPAAPVTPIESSFKVNDKLTISSEDLHKAVDLLNSKLQDLNRNVNFSIDQASGRDVVRVTNSNTGEVVRQLPFEESLQFMRNLDRMIGLIFDQTA